MSPKFSLAVQRCTESFVRDKVAVEGEFDARWGAGGYPQLEGLGFRARLERDAPRPKAALRLVKGVPGLTLTLDSQ